MIAGMIFIQQYKNENIIPSSDNISALLAFLKTVFSNIGINNHPISINGVYTMFKLLMIKLSNKQYRVMIIEVLNIPSFFEYRTIKNIVKLILGRKFNICS